MSGVVLPNDRSRYRSGYLPACPWISGLSLTGWHTLWLAAYCWRSLYGLYSGVSALPHDAPRYSLIGIIVIATVLVTTFFLVQLW